MLGGAAIGLASNLSPMYIAEVAPAQMRGRLVSINQLTIVIGVLLAQFVNWWIVRDLPRGLSEEAMAHSWYVPSGWRWMFGITAVPSLLFFFGMFVVPESPRWLAKNGKQGPAQDVLARIGGKDYAVAAIAEIESTLVNETASVRFSELLEPKMARVLALGVLLAVFQQWCGINVIFNYAEEIFRGRIRHLRRPEEHRLDGLGESGIHLRRPGSRRSRRTPAADAAGGRRTGPHLYRLWASVTPFMSRACPCSCWCSPRSAVTACRWPR